jgi:hypothetical protein
VRQDKSVSQRLKLRRAADSFDFNALIEGVSTLVDEPKREPAEPKVNPVEPVTLEAPAELPVPRDRNVGPDVALLANLPTAEPEPPIVSPRPVAARVEAEEIGKAPVVPPAPQIQLPQEAARAEESVCTPESAGQRDAQLAPSSPGAGQLRVALTTLGSRLIDEVARMGAAMRSGDADSAGFYLAHTNQVLELLGTIDPTGDLSREYGTENAPPLGRTWPSTAWSVAEFAQSPMSAMLPADADEEFVQDLVYASWGVSRSG